MSSDDEFVPVTMVVFEDGVEKFVRRTDLDVDAMRVKLYLGGGEWHVHQVDHIEYHTTNDLLLAFIRNTPLHTILHLP